MSRNIKQGHLRFWLPFESRLLSGEHCSLVESHPPLDVGHTERSSPSPLSGHWAFHLKRSRLRRSEHAEGNVPPTVGTPG